MIIDSRFEIIRKLGQGGMAEVYLANDINDGSDVALKMTTPKSEALKNRFIREIKILAEVNHENIVRLISSGSFNNNLWYAMEYIEGKQFTDWFFSSGNIDYIQIAKIVSKIASALDIIHNIGIIHRDLKPENILVRNNIPIVVDFGVAHIKNNDQITKLTRAGSMVGTVQYMSPEQVTGSNIDGRSDLYSLGVIMYQILTGEHPSEADELPRLIMRILQERPIRPTAINPDIPKDLEQIVMKLLEKNPDIRFKSAKELEFALLQFAGGMGVEKSDHQSPLRSVAKAEIPLIGRSRELNSFSLLLHAARAGQGQVALVLGEKGFGKTRLVEEFKLVALSELSKFLTCSKQPEGSSRPAISAILDRLADYDFSCDHDLIRKHPHMIRSLSPKLADVLGIEKDPPNIQDRNDVPFVISELLASAFPEIPSIFAFEDGLDELSLSVAFELARKTTDKKVIVCLISKEKTELEPWTELPNYTEIQLKPFTENQVEELANHVLGRKPSDSELLRVKNTSKGSPYLAIQILSAIKNESKTISTASIPVDIESVYKANLEKLEANSSGLLHILSLISRPIPLSLLKPLSRLSGNEFQDAYEVLDGFDLITEKNSGRGLEIQLATETLKDIILPTIEGQYLKKLHLMIASTLDIFYSGTKNPDVLASIGRHYYDAGDIENSAKYIVKSDTMLRELGYGTNVLGVAELFSDKLDEIRNIDTLADVLIRIITILSTESKLEDTERIIHKFEELEQKRSFSEQQLVLIFFEISEAYRRFWLIPKSVEYQRKIEPLQEFTDDDSKRKIISVKMEIAIDQGDIEKLGTHIEEFQDLLKRTKADENSLIMFHQFKAIYHVETGDGDGAIGEFLKALDIAREINKKHSEMGILSNIGYAYAVVGEPEKSVEYQKQALELAKEQKDESQQIHILRNVNGTYVSMGDVSQIRQSLAMFRELLEKRSFSDHNLAWIKPHLFVKCLEGECDGIEGLLEDYKTKALELNQSSWLRQLYMHEMFFLFHSKKLKKAKIFGEQIKYLLSTLKDDPVDADIFDVNHYLIVLSIELDENIAEANKLLSESRELAKKNSWPVRSFILKYLNAHIHYAKSCVKPLFGSKKTFDSNSWRIAYLDILDVFEKTKAREFVLSTIPTDSVFLFAKLIVLRMNHDKKMDKVERRQIFEQAVKQIEWLLERYRKYNFKYRQSEIIDLNNELIRLM